MQQIGFLLQNLLFDQHVSGTIMPIIRSSRIIQMLQNPANRTHNLQVHTRPTTCKPKNQVPQAAAISVTTAPDDGHNGARNMLNEQ
jgi:hypothetical protein